MSTPKPDLEALILGVTRSPAIDGGCVDEVWELVLDAVLAGLKVQRASGWMLGEGRGRLCCVALRDQRAGAVMHESATLAREANPAYFAAIDTERALLAHDAMNDPRTAEFRDSYLKPRSISALLDVPVRFHGEMVGIICCEHVGGVREWRSEEGAFVAALADVVGRALTAESAVRAEAALRENNAMLERRIAERTRELQDALTHLMDTRDQLIAREKVAVIGDISPKVAHDINTPLGNAVTAASTLQERLDELRGAFASGKLTRSSFADFTSHADEALSLLVSNLNRAKRLVHDFMRTAVDQISEARDRFALSETLDALLASLRPVTKHVPVTPVLDCPATLVVDGYAGVIAQIVTNLVVNSCRHGFGSQADPTITITVTCDGETVRLVYADNGCGIPPQLHQRVFEPFFTTQRAAGGTGLGLSIVHNLVHGRLGGTIALRSSPGEGVHFTIEFPRVLPVGP
ncbi:GAF domain-containing sensor histidine kinase [Niveibacterium sp. 24ML]|uniref:sensor histidine kinase n=1 Tax=Niveibacterium sp. 24ML TaxID=2985512 RepID=UPI00226ED1F1|nr:GAF domain-containing sensor histidine kinase [Niveibacterium sp. 24ML]MCX9156459.1 GAF domain-containing sensor histidine kinase [Niveibacterium sp. 24ML]